MGIRLYFISTYFSQIKDYLISLGQLAKKKNHSIYSKGVHLLAKNEANASDKLNRKRGLNNLYTLSKDSKTSKS